MLWQNNQYCHNRIVMTKQLWFLMIFDDHREKSQLTAFSTWLLVPQSPNSCPDCCADPCKYKQIYSRMCGFGIFIFFCKYSWEQKVMVFVFSRSKYKATEPPAWISRYSFSENILVNIHSPLRSFHAGWDFHCCLRKYHCCLASLKISDSTKYQVSQRQEIPAPKQNFSTSAYVLHLQTLLWLPVFGL